MNEDKIKFHSLNRSRIDRLKTSDIDNDYSSKEFKLSQEYNSVLLSVIKKDIDMLLQKYRNMINDLINTLSNNGISNNGFSSDISLIDDTLRNILKLEKDIHNKAKKIKVGMFSTNKKKTEKENKEELYKYIVKTKNDIIFTKNEYIKLTRRINNVTRNQEEEKDYIEDDPLERTINFYMNKKG